MTRNCRFQQVRKSISLKKTLSLVLKVPNSSRSFPNNVPKNIFFMCNSPISGERTSCVWWVCHVLSVVQLKQGYQLISEMKEMVVHWRDQSWTVSAMSRWVPRVGQCGREGGCGQQGGVTGNTVLIEVVCVSGIYLYWAWDSRTLNAEPRIY